MSAERDDALAYLKEQMGEGWRCAVDSNDYDGDFVAAATHGDAVRVEATAPDPMSAARACVEAWREATTALRENLEFRENDLAVSRARENAEREHADRLAEALRSGDPRVHAAARTAHDARRSGGA